VDAATKLRRRSAFDAAYLALALSLDAELWTLDGVCHEALCDREGVRDLFCQPVAAGW
jgi:predicted nucleic acid-binding protein